MQPVRNIAVHFDGNFAAPPLRLHHPRQGDEFVLIQTSHGSIRINPDSKYLDSIAQTTSPLDFLNPCKSALIRGRFEFALAIPESPTRSAG